MHLECSCGSFRFLRPVMMEAQKPLEANMIGQFELAVCSKCMKEYGFNFVTNTWEDTSAGVRPYDLERYARP